MPIGNLTAFLTTYIAQILISVMMAMMMVILVPRAMASADRVEEVLDAVRSVSDPPRPVTTVGSTGAVEFRTVTFRYPGSEHPVLHALTFTIRPGQACAIIGGTGSGKSTGLNLIPRFFDATAGTVLVNGADVRDQDLEQLWSCIGLVPQRAFLFSGTVASNLRFGRPEATEAELWHALTVAQARDFVASMPGQLDAPIDQGDTNVPGGRRQRPPIARALVKRPGCTCRVAGICPQRRATGRHVRQPAAHLLQQLQLPLVGVIQHLPGVLGAVQRLVRLGPEQHGDPAAKTHPGPRPFKRPRAAPRSYAWVRPRGERLSAEGLRNGHRRLARGRAQSCFPCAGAKERSANQRYDPLGRVLRSWRRRPGRTSPG